MRPDKDIGSHWKFDVGAGRAPGDEGGSPCFEAGDNNQTEGFHEAETVVSPFDNPPFFTRLGTFGVRVKYPF